MEGLFSKVSAPVAGVLVFAIAIVILLRFESVTSIAGIAEFGPSEEDLEKINELNSEIEFQAKKIFELKEGLAVSKAQLDNFNETRDQLAELTSNLEQLEKEREFFESTLKATQAEAKALQNFQKENEKKMESLEKELNKTKKAVSRRDQLIAEMENRFSIMSDTFSSIRSCYQDYGSQEKSDTERLRCVCMQQATYEGIDTGLRSEWHYDSSDCRKYF